VRGSEKYLNLKHQTLFVNKWQNSPRATSPEIKFHTGFKLQGILFDKIDQED